MKPNFGGWASETWRSALGLAARQIPGLPIVNRAFHFLSASSNATALTALELRGCLLLMSLNSLGKLALVWRQHDLRVRQNLDRLEQPIRRASKTRQRVRVYVPQAFSTASRSDLILPVTSSSGLVSRWTYEQRTNTQTSHPLFGKSPLNFATAAARYYLQVGQHLRGDGPLNCKWSLNWLEKEIGSTMRLGAIDDAMVARLVASGAGRA